jgi:NAD-dependent SIR2 family protein deacetylase
LSFVVPASPLGQGCSDAPLALSPAIAVAWFAPFQAFNPNSELKTPPVQLCRSYDPNFCRTMFAARRLSSAASTFVPPATRSTTPLSADVCALATFLESHRKVLVLTGAGVSTESGIPDYRSPQGSYSVGHKPLRHQEFVGDEGKRKRYWARGLIGYAHFDAAQPNASHRALAQLERDGHTAALITQNVDQLHQQAGSRRVLELHGNGRHVRCLDCGFTESRAAFHDTIEHANDAWLKEHLPQRGLHVDIRADGDAHLDNDDFSGFHIPGCPKCAALSPRDPWSTGLSKNGANVSATTACSDARASEHTRGVMMPTVVFFGGTLDPGVRERCTDWTRQADALLVCGSSVTVFSSFRICRAAAEAGKPIAIVNIGETRADKLGGAVSLKIERRCGEVLPALAVEMRERKGACRPWQTVP